MGLGGSGCAMRAGRRTVRSIATCCRDTAPPVTAVQGPRRSGGSTPVDIVFHYDLNEHADRLSCGAKPVRLLQVSCQSRDVHGR